LSKKIFREKKTFQKGSWKKFDLVNTRLSFKIQKNSFEKKIDFIESSKSFFFPRIFSVHLA